MLCLDSLNLNFDTANQSNTAFFISPVPWSCYHRDSLFPINIYFLGDFMFTPDFFVSYRTRWVQGSFANKNFAFLCGKMNLSGSFPNMQPQEFSLLHPVLWMQINLHVWHRSDFEFLFWVQLYFIEKWHWKVHCTFSWWSIEENFITGDKRSQC